MLISDVDLERRVAKVSLGKGRKDRYVRLNPREIEGIRLYLEKGHPKLAGEKPTNGLLFIGRGGRKLTRQRVWQVFACLGLRVLERKTSPHKFRHAFVTDTITAEPSLA